MKRYMLQQRVRRAQRNGAEYITVRVVDVAQLLDTIAQAMGKGFTIIERQDNGRYMWDLTYNGVCSFGVEDSEAAAERAANTVLRALKEGE